MNNIDYSNKKINFINSKISVKISQRLSNSELCQFYLCFDVNSASKTYCLKIATAKADDKPTNSSINKEIVILLSFTHIANIITILDYCSTNSQGMTTYFILFEYSEEGSLYEVIRKASVEKRTMSDVLVWKYTQQIALGLKTIHDNKYAHRDIQPKNVLLFCSGSVVKIGDFGSVTNKFYESLNNASNRAEVVFDISKHTLQFYRAPEEVNVYSGGAINEKSDMWALGLVLFAMLFSALPSSPFESFYFGLLGSKCLNPSLLAQMKKISNPYLVELMRNLLKVNPKERPSAGDILIYLDKYLDQATKFTSSYTKERLLFGKNLFKSITDSIKKNSTSFCMMKLLLPFPDEVPQLKYIKYLVQKGWEKDDKVNAFYRYLSCSLMHFFTLSGLKAMLLLHQYIFLGRHDFLHPPHFNLEEQLALFSTVWAYRAQSSAFDKGEIIRSNQIAKFLAAYAEFLRKKLALLIKYEPFLDSNNSLLSNDYLKIISKAFIDDSLCFFSQTNTLLSSVPFSSNLILGTLDVIAHCLNEELVSMFNLLFYTLIAYKNTGSSSDKQPLESDFIQFASKGRESLERLRRFRLSIHSQWDTVDFAYGESYSKAIDYLQSVKYNSGFSLKNHFSIDMSYFGVKMNRNNMGSFEDKSEETALISNNSEEEDEDGLPPQSTQQFDFNEENFAVNKHFDFQLKKRPNHKEKRQRPKEDLIECSGNDKPQVIEKGGEANNEAFQTAKSQCSAKEEKYPSNMINLFNDIFESKSSLNQSNSLQNDYFNSNDPFNQLFANKDRDKQNNALVPFADLVKNTSTLANDNKPFALNAPLTLKPIDPLYYQQGQIGFNQQQSGSSQMNSSGIYNNSIYSTPSYSSNKQSFGDSSSPYLWNNLYIQPQPQQSNNQPQPYHQAYDSSKIAQTSNNNFQPTAMPINNNKAALNQLMNSFTPSIDKASFSPNPLPNQSQSQNNSQSRYESANSQLSNINIINIVENYNIGSVIENRPQIDKLANDFLRGEFCKPNFHFLIASKDINLGRRIGFGGSSEVFIGNYRGTEVAVKKLRILEVKDENLKEFKREVSSLSMLRHPNLVLFMGAIAEPNSICIVTEYCAGGTLFNVLHQRQELILTWSLRLRILLEIATGMNFLHTNEPPIIHRDLKSLNILLTDKIDKPTDLTTIKISDFGLSKIINQLDTTKEAMMTGQLGTCHWMAPEVIKSTYYTIKADVYSFAIIIWEMCTRTTPYKDMTQQQISLYVSVKKGRPEKSIIPPNTPVGVRLTKLMEMCWDDNANARPSFQQIISYLKTIKEKFDHL